MSADSLYHAFGLRGYSVHAIRSENNEIVLETRQSRESLRCPVCGSSRVFSQGQSLRRFRTLPIGTQPVIIELAVPLRFRRRGTTTPETASTHCQFMLYVKQRFSQGVANSSENMRGNSVI